MPCFNAFCAARALPSVVFGPLDFAPLRRLASARAWLTGTAARGAASALDMGRIPWLEVGWRRGIAAAPGRAVLAEATV